MQIESIFYLIDCFKNVDFILNLVSFFYIFGGLILISVSSISYSDGYTTYEKSFLRQVLNNFRNYLYIPIIAIIINCFIPSEKTMYLMVGAKYLKESSIPSKVEAVLNKKLDEYLAEDKKDKL